MYLAAGIGLGFTIGIGFALGAGLVALVALRVVTWWSNRGWNKTTVEVKNDKSA